ncbi:MAG: hypothetical protein QXO25_02240 [Candidatus Bathyarchaeia archaeon]
MSQGNVCTHVNNTGVVLDLDVDASAPVGTTKVTAIGDFTTSALPNADFTHGNSLGVGNQYWLWIDTGPGSGQGGVIHTRVNNDTVDVYWVTSNTAKIATALDSTSDYIVVTDFRVEKANAATDLCVCVPQVDVPSGYFFWGLYFGKGVVLFDTDGNPLSSSNLALIPSTQAGYAQGTSATPSAAEVLSVFGRSYVDQAVDGLILANINCMWTCPATHVVFPASVTLPYPRTSGE